MAYTLKDLILALEAASLDHPNVNTAYHGPVWAKGLPEDLNYLVVFWEIDTQGSTINSADTWNLSFTVSDKPHDYAADATITSLKDPIQQDLNYRSKLLQTAHEIIANIQRTIRQATIVNYDWITLTEDQQDLPVSVRVDFVLTLPTSANLCIVETTNY